MKKCMEKYSKIVLGIVLSALVIWQGTAEVFAINTKFDVPSIEEEWTPDNCLYKSPNLNIMVCKWGYGLTADLLNTSSVDTLLAELHANISPSGYNHSILGIYMEGAGLSDANVSAIANAGWEKIELYYENFFVSGSAPTAAMTPSVAKVNDEAAAAVLNRAGIEGDAAVFQVFGVNMTSANIILYEKEFKFLKGKTLHSYKFIKELEVFVPVEETYFGSYGANFLELYDLQKAEADVNGIYVTLTQSLPDAFVVSAEQISALKESLSVASPVPAPSEDEENKEQAISDKINNETPTQKPEGGNEETVEQKPEGDNEEVVEQKPENEQVIQEEMTQEPDILSVLTVKNTDQTVEWKFSDGEKPVDFTAEAIVKAISQTEVSVDFAYSGLLPENTQVTVQIPRENMNYKKGDILYLYYCNPEIGQREFVSEGVYEGKEVTFRIQHCSEYIITTTAPNEDNRTEKSMPLWLPGILLGVIVCGLVGVAIVRKRSQKTK